MRQLHQAQPVLGAPDTVRLPFIHDLSPGEDNHQECPCTPSCCELYILDPHIVLYIPQPEPICNAYAYPLFAVHYILLNTGLCVLYIPDPLTLHLVPVRPKQSWVCKFNGRDRGRKGQEYKRKGKREGGRISKRVGRRKEDEEIGRRKKMENERGGRAEGERMRKSPREKETGRRRKGKEKSKK